LLYFSFSHIVSARAAIMWWLHLYRTLLSKLRTSTHRLSTESLLGCIFSILLHIEVKNCEMIFDSKFVNKLQFVHLLWHDTSSQ